MNLFGKKKPAPAPKLGDSIQKLREVLTTLDKREQHLQNQMKQALAEAKAKSKAKDKRGAMYHLKRKKMIEKQVDQIYGKKMNIETQILALEGASSNKEVLGVMRQGKDALKSSIKESDIENVDDVMSDITESIQLADEMGEAMSQQIGPVHDEDELEAELNEMESELQTDELQDVVKDAPKVPVKKIAVPEPEKPVEKTEKKTNKKEEDELKELESRFSTIATNGSVNKNDYARLFDKKIL